MLLNKIGALTQPYGFSTKRYNAHVGMLQYEYRNYLPEIGRWTTRDPLGEAGGLNLYAFVGNNPVNWVDPWGLCTPNGCGPANPKWLAMLIPEGFFPNQNWGYDFTPPCNGHDVCYATSGMAKEQCDNNFRDELRGVCDEWVERMYGPNGVWASLGDGMWKEIDRKLCYNDAEIYYLADFSE